MEYFQPGIPSAFRKRVCEELERAPEQRKAAEELYQAVRELIDPEYARQRLGRKGAMDDETARRRWFRMLVQSSAHFSAEYNDWRDFFKGTIRFVSEKDQKKVFTHAFCTTCGAGPLSLDHRVLKTVAYLKRFAHSESRRSHTLIPQTSIYLCDSCADREIKHVLSQREGGIR